MGPQFPVHRAAVAVQAAPPRGPPPGDALSLAALAAANPRPSEATLRTREKIGLGELLLTLSSAGWRRAGLSRHKWRFIASAVKSLLKTGDRFSPSRVSDSPRRHLLNPLIFLRLSPHTDPSRRHPVPGRRGCVGLQPD